MPKRNVLLLTVVSGLTLWGCKDPISSSPPPPGPAAKDATAAAPASSSPAAPADAKQGLATALTADSGSVAPASAAPGASGAASPVGQGFIRTPSGLEYEVLAAGQGETPPLGSRVLLNYTGTLPNRQTFAETRGGPREFKLDRLSLIDGWVEALLGMKKGEKRRLKVPSALAYGQKGYAGLVPPNSDLAFELELVAFTPPGGAGRAPR